MGTPSRVKGGLQEMRTVVELMSVTLRLLTGSNGPADNNDYNVQEPGAEGLHL